MGGHISKYVYGTSDASTAAEITTPVVTPAIVRNTRSVSTPTYVASADDIAVSAAVAAAVAAAVGVMDGNVDTATVSSIGEQRIGYTNNKRNIKMKKY